MAFLLMTAAFVAMTAMYLHERRARFFAERRARVLERALGEALEREDHMAQRLEALRL